MIVVPDMRNIDRLYTVPGNNPVKLWNKIPADL
jgi:hypothetical protein